MRFESKLQFFKRASHLGNFKNIALTVAQRHQRWLCYHLASGNLLKPNFECGPLRTPTVPLSSLPESLAYCIASTIPACSNETAVFNPKSVKFQGNFYSNNNSYIITGSDGLNPIFGKILDIFLICSRIVLLYAYQCSKQCNNQGQFLFNTAHFQYYCKLMVANVVFVVFRYL